MYKWFDKIFHPLQTINDVLNGDGDYKDMMELTTVIYEKSYSGLDLMKYIEQSKSIDDLKKYQMLLVFNKIKKEFKSEKLFILFILNFMLLRSDYDLENISFM
jgi:hypothetical protein